MSPLNNQYIYKRLMILQNMLLDWYFNRQSFDFLGVDTAEFNLCMKELESLIEELQSCEQ